MNPFYKVSSNAISFEVKGYGPVFVGLAEKPSNNVLYWVRYTFKNFKCDNGFYM